MVKEYSQVPTVYSSIVETKMFCKKSKSDLMAFESDKLSAELQRWAAMLRSHEYHSRQNHCGTKIHNYSTNCMLVCGQCYCHKCIQHENVWDRTLLDTQLRMTLRYGIIKHCCIHHLTCQISLCSATSTMSVRGVPAVDIAPMPEDAMTKVQDLLLPDLVYILIILFLLNAGHVSLS